MGWLLGYSSSNDNSGWWRGGSSLLDAAWRALTLFALPPIMLRGHGPVEALRESSTMLRTTWGKNLMGNFRIALNLRIMFIPALELVGLGTYPLVAGSLLIGPGLLALGSSASSAARSSARLSATASRWWLLDWATTGEAVGSLEAAELREAIRAR